MGLWLGGSWIVRLPHWLESSCQELLGRGRLKGATGWGLALLSHWLLSHQHELRLPGLVCVDPMGQALATRGESHICGGARDSSKLWYQPQPAPWAVSCVLMVPETPGHESSIGRMEQALDCPVLAGVLRIRGSTVGPGWMLLASQPLM